jgi:hypothetical protein
LHCLRRAEGASEFVPDHFSLEGLRGFNTVKPSTIEAVRQALGDASLRS